MRAGALILSTVSLWLGIADTTLAVALPTSGVCGFAIVLRRPFDYLDGSSPGSGYGVNWLGTINFSTSTITSNVVLQNPGNAATTTESQISVSATFTKSAGPISGSTTIAFTPFSNQWTLNLIPVNDGLTILVQAYSPVAGNQDAAAVGVCRMQ